jgi:hypothetical protein
MADSALQLPTTSNPASIRARQSHEGVHRGFGSAQSDCGYSLQMERVLAQLLHPDRLFNGRDVLERPCPLPSAPGVYAWYFREIPTLVPTAGCHRIDDLTLLYVGISPGRTPRAEALSRPPTVRKRVRYHLRGNAEGSTLRLSLGCLLQQLIGIELRRVGSGKRLTFGPGERLLSQWMAQNACVAYTIVPEPWTVEHQLISKLSLPLNIDQNAQHPFSARLSMLRSEARLRARSLPVL